MKQMSDRSVTYGVVAISVIIAAASGITYGDGYSNHWAYIPPGLRLLDPSFLAADWWATEVRHYHVVFFWLVAGLRLAGILEWTLAIGNVVIITAVLSMTFLWIKRYRPENAFLIWSFFLTVYVATWGLNSVGDSNFFTYSLEASTISTICTFLAMWTFGRGHLTKSGLLLGVAGLFHANFLIVNLMAFPLALLITARTYMFSDLRRFLSVCTRLLAPSLVVLLFMVPMILGVVESGLSPADRELASFVFFDFALPFHYVPNTFLMEFLPLAGWHLLGLAWCRSAFAGHADGERWWALFVGMVVAIWVATLLTTVVFVEPVSRLFVWRLAPFSLWLAVLFTFAGAWGHLRDGDDRTSRRTLVALILSVIGCLLLARYMQFRWGLFAVRPLMIYAIPAALVALALLQRVLGPARWGTLPAMRWIVPVLVLACLTSAFGSKAHESWRERHRFNLVCGPCVDPNLTALYAWIRTETAPDSTISTPPDLGGVRLLGERAVIVDQWSLPHGRGNLLEWYARLAATSGLERPPTLDAVTEGYAKTDDARLNALRARYGADFAVFETGTGPLDSRFPIAYANGGFVVYDLREAPSQPQSS